jgi:hypothetical protein
VCRAAGRWDLERATPPEKRDHGTSRRCRLILAAMMPIPAYTSKTAR